MPPTAATGYSAILEPGKDDPANELGVTLAAAGEFLVAAVIETRSIEAYELIDYQWHSRGTVLVASLPGTLSDDEFVQLAKTSLNIVINKKSDGTPCVFVSLPKLDNQVIGTFVQQTPPLETPNLLLAVVEFAKFHPFVSAYQRDFDPLKTDYTNRYGTTFYTFDSIYDEATGETYEEHFDTSGSPVGYEYLYRKIMLDGQREDLKYISAGCAYLFSLNAGEWRPTFEITGTSKSSVGGSIAMSDNGSTLVLTASGEREERREMYYQLRTRYTSVFRNKYFYYSTWYKEWKYNYAWSNYPSSSLNWQDDIVDSDSYENLAYTSTTHFDDAKEYVLIFKFDATTNTYQQQSEIDIPRSELKAGVYPSLAFTSTVDASMLALEVIDGIKIYLKPEAFGGDQPYQSDNNPLRPPTSVWSNPPADTRWHVELSSQSEKPKLVIKASTPGEQCIYLYEGDKALNISWPNKKYKWAGVTGFSLGGSSDPHPTKSIAMSKDGNTLVVGDPTNNDYRGSVYIYELVDDGGGRVYNEVGSFEGEAATQIGRTVAVAQEDEKFRIFFGSAPSRSHPHQFLNYGYEFDVTAPTIVAHAGQKLNLSDFMSLPNDKDEAMYQVLQLFQVGSVKDSGSNEPGSKKVVIGQAVPVSTYMLANVIKKARRGIIPTPRHLKVKYVGSDFAGNSKESWKQYYILDDVAPSYDVCVNGVPITSGSILRYEAGVPLPDIEIKNLFDQDGTPITDENLFLNVAAPGDEADLVQYTPEKLHEVVDCYPRMDSDGNLIAPDNLNPNCMNSGKYFVELFLSDTNDPPNYKQKFFTVYVTDKTPPIVDLTQLSGFYLDQLAGDGVEVECNGISLKDKKNNAIKFAENNKLIPDVNDLAAVTNDEGDKCAGKQTVIVRSSVVTQILSQSDNPQNLAKITVTYTATDNSIQHPINADTTQNPDRVSSTSVDFNILIKDTIAPVLTIPPNKTLEFGNNFDPPSPEDAGTATAVDDCCEVTVENGGITYEDTEEDLSDNTDKRIMAIIKRKWKAKDESGNFSIDIDDNHIQTITLEDTKPAVLTLVGPSHVRIKEGMPYEDPGVEAVDYPEGSLSQVTVHTFGLPSSNPPRAGRHVIVYTAVDGGGNVSDAVRRWVTVTACFTGDAILSTDQGLVEIKAVDTTYTINGEAIKGISETIYTQDKIVAIEKNAFGANKPNKKTLVAPFHKFLINGKMRMAAELVNEDSIYLTKYKKQPLYNIILEKQDLMIINNVIVETLNPESLVAKLFDGSMDTEQRNKVIDSIHKYHKNLKKKNKKTIKDYRI